MYRKPSGDMGFSFQRFMNNAAPSFMMDSTADPGHMSGVQKDMVFELQINKKDDPTALYPVAFSASGIIDGEELSHKIFKKLQKAHILNEAGRVDTRQIGPDYTNQLAVISVIRQKQLIDMLFWWEGESERLQRIDETGSKLEDDLQRAKEQHDKEAVENLTSMLRELETTRRERPTARSDQPHLGTGSSAPHANEHLPQYQGQGGSRTHEQAPQYEGGGGHADQHLPLYRAHQ